MHMRQGGGTVVGLIVGLVVGLAIAVAVAVYITHAPLPFVTKVQRPTTTKLNTAPDAPLPDPNRALYGNSKAEPVQPAATEQKPAEATPSPESAGDTKTAGVPAAAAPAADKAGTDAAAQPTRYQLQVGAFKAPDEADAMLAQLALLGQQARIFPIDQGGRTLYRVRLGPYGQIDEVNRVRKLLSDNSIDSQIVRLK
jgi:cell division protein FtsN